MSLDRFLSILEVLPLDSKLLTGLVPVDLSIPVLELSFTVGKRACKLRDVVVVLRVEGKMNLFAIFPIGATMQDGGKRKRSDATDCHHAPCNKLLILKFFKKIGNLRGLRVVWPRVTVPSNIIRILQHAWGTRTVCPTEARGRNSWRALNLQKCYQNTSGMLLPQGTGP